jgi:hypothetical protein
MPIPTTAKMMWKASEMAICERAARRSIIGLPGASRLSIAPTLPAHSKPERGSPALSPEGIALFFLRGRRDPRPTRSPAPGGTPATSGAARSGSPQMPHDPSGRGPHLQALDGGQLELSHELPSRQTHDSIVHSMNLES